MPKKSNETTTRFRVDITELKAGIREANRQISLANSEFKKASAGMEKWSEDADGLSAKLQQLKDVTKQYENILEMLQKQYDKVASEEGEASKGAIDLKVKINNLEATIKNNQASMTKYEAKLSDIQKQSDITASGTDELGKELKEAGNEAKNSSDGFTVAKGALADLVADGIREAIGALKEFTKDVDTANTNFRAQTGLSAAEAKQFNKEMQEIYKNGYGESLNEVADSMAKVKQQTNETDPTKIKELTENAMAFTDVFGGDFNENLRGANALIINMGLSGEQAFDYIAKAAQNGLDRSGELTDNLAEYAQLFGQAGFSAEEMFAILDNGLDSGAYNLDKVNDFVKEFGNSLADGRIEENLSNFSEETQNLFWQWKTGKASTKDVFYSVINDLDQATNKQEALTLASTVWSALGEDNAMKVIQSLNDVNGTFEDVEGTMNEVKDIKYSDVTSQIKSLGRTIQTDVFMPLAQKALPAAKDFVGYVSNNLDDLIPLAEGLGIAMGSIFVVNKVVAFGKALTALTNPVGLIVTGFGLLTGALIATNIEQDAYLEKTYGITEEQQKLVDEIDETTESYKNMKKSMDDSVESVTSQYAHLEQLKEELAGIVDENGKVKSGYEERASFIVGQLSESLGMEISLTDGVIEKYNELIGSIEEVMQKKKAEAMLNATKSGYEEAIQKQTEAYKEYNDVLKEVKKERKELDKAEEEYSKKKKSYDELLEGGGITLSQYTSMIVNARKEVEAQQETYDKLNKKLEESSEAYTGYCDTITNYEELYGAVISANAAETENAMIRIQNSFINAENGTKTSLQNQVENAKEMYDSMKAALAEKAPGVTQQMVNDAKTMVDMATAELNKFEQNGMLAGIKGGEGFASGLSSKEEDVKRESGKLTNSANLTLNNLNSAFIGERKGEEYGAGIASKDGKTKKSGEKVAKSAKDGLESVDAKEAGTNFASGFADAMKSKYSITSVFEAAWNLGRKALSALTESLDEHSPSEESYKSGENFVFGFRNAVADKYKEAVSVVKKMAKESMEPISDMQIGIPEAKRKVSQNMNMGTGRQTISAGGWYQQGEEFLAGIMELVNRKNEMAPTFIVQIGNKEFDNYIIKKSEDGLARKMIGKNRAKGV
ncbi:hypothetical protein B5F37_11570 [Drancourtella sp. An210]|nr:hypothetical protein B5F37_11570 [Drancourtella sp. An210]